MAQLYYTDRVLLYDVEPWNKYGFGVPNFGDNIATQNHSIHKLVDEIGRIQLSIATHTDARMTTPPSMNTVKRLCKAVNRVRTVLSSRQRAENEDRVESLHVQPAPQIFVVHPVPYFNPEFLTNTWIKEYNALIMTALTNMMQHSENSYAHTISTSFAADIWQYFNEIKIFIATELLNVPKSAARADEFTFTPDLYASYKPSELVVRTESLDQPAPMFSDFTEDALRPLYRGIAATLIKPFLKQYPVGPIPGNEGVASDEADKNIEAEGAADGTATIETISAPSV